MLSHAAGADGMVAGQVIDTLCGVSTQQELTGMYRLKTGVMISAAAELGRVASGMPAAMRQQAIAFCRQAGLGLSDSGRYAGCGGRRGCVRQAHRFRSREGKVTFVDVLGLEGLRTAWRRYPPGRGGHPPVAGSRLPVDAGSLAGGEKEGGSIKGSVNNTPPVRRGILLPMGVSGNSWRRLPWRRSGTTSARAAAPAATAKVRPPPSRPAGRSAGREMAAEK